MKLRSQFALPPVDRSSVLPLLLAMLLGAALVFQALGSREPDLPTEGPIRAASVGDIVAERPRPAMDASSLVARSMFAPAASSSTAAGTAQGPLGPYVVAGSIQVGRSTYAVVRGPGARTGQARPGALIGEWRVQSVTRDEVRLSRGDERLSIRFGQNGPLAVATTQGGQ